MIYILVLDASDYDESAKNIFASTSKKVIEDKISFLKTRNLFLEEVSKSYNELEADIIRKHPLPERPNLKSLPPRPLVWKDYYEDYYGWSNPYIIDYDKECKKIDDACHEDVEKLRTWFAELHSLSTDEMNDIQNHVSFEYLEYSIDEVESD